MFMLLPVFTFAQETVNDIINRGIVLHDEGKYKEAIAVYEEAIKTDNKNAKAYYEMAYSYSAFKDYPNTIKYCDKAIALKTKPASMKAYLLKGASLDYSGKPKDAIKTFKEGIKFAPEFYSLYYSLGLTNFKIKEYDEAEKNFKESLLLNPIHAGSHYSLSLLVSPQKAKSMLAKYNFLIIEPMGEKANKAYNSILAKQKEGVEVKDESNINITLDMTGDGDDFSTAEMMIAMGEAYKNIPENKDKSDFEMFSENTKSFFIILGELKEKNPKKDKGFWWDFYVTFFYDLAKNESMYETFTYYISQDINSTQVDMWMEKNGDKIDEFLQWVQNYKRL